MAHNRSDVSAADGLRGLAKRLAGTRIDWLICNAGILRYESLDALDEDSIREQLEVNALGPLRTVHALLPCLRMQHVLVRQPILPTQYPARAILHSVACCIGAGRFFDFCDHFQHATGAATILSFAARPTPELMLAKEQWKPHLGHFEAAKLDPAGRLPFTAAWPAIG